MKVTSHVLVPIRISGAVLRLPLFGFLAWIDDMLPFYMYVLCNDTFSLLLVFAYIPKADRQTELLCNEISSWNPPKHRCVHYRSISLAKTCDCMLQ
jgi:hypothetical protein